MDADICIIYGLLSHTSSKKVDKKDVAMKRVIAELSDGALSANQISGILGSPKEFPTSLIEKLSIETALKYWKGKISYEAADFIMNNLYSFWVNDSYFVEVYSFPDVAWECFEAFDAGEYCRVDDDKNISPEAKYTKPRIEKLLKSRMLIA